MLQIMNYCIVNGSKSAITPFKKEVENLQELEKLRKELEKEKCYKETKTITGTKKEKVSSVMFTYREVD